MLRILLKTTPVSTSYTLRHLSSPAFKVNVNQERSYKSKKNENSQESSIRTPYQKENLDALLDARSTLRNPTIKRRAFREIGTFYEFTALHREDVARRSATLVLQAESLLNFGGLENSEYKLIEDIKNFMLTAFPKCKSHLSAVSLHAKSITNLTRERPIDLLMLAAHPENPKLEIFDYMEKVKDYNSSLACWIDVTLKQTNYKFAVDCVERERLVSRKPYGIKKGVFVNDSSVYVQLMNAAVKEKDIDCVHKILDMQEMDGLPPSFACLVSVLEFVGRALSDDRFDSEKLKTLASDTMSKLTIKALEDYLLRLCVTDFEERCYITNAAQLVDIHFEHRPYPLQGPDGDDYKHYVLSTFKEYKRANVTPFGVITSSALLEGFDKQLEREKTVDVEIQPVTENSSFNNSYRRQLSKTEEEHLRLSIDTLKDEWKEKLHSGFQKLLRREEKALKIRSTGVGILPFLQLFPEDYYVTVLLEEIERLAEDTSFSHMPLMTMYKRLSGILEQKFKVEKIQPCQQKYREAYEKYMEYNMAHMSPYEQQRLKFVSAVGSTDAWKAVRFQHPPWSTFIRWKLGKELYDILFTLRFDAWGKTSENEKDRQPVVVQVIEDATDGPMSVIKLHPDYLSMLDLVSDFPLKFPAHEMPMLCPPIPWIWIQRAGYLISDCQANQFIRQNERSMSQTPFELRGSELSLKQMRNLAPNLDALNILAACPWTVNKSVLDVALKVFRAGGDPDLSIPLDEVTFDRRFEEKNPLRLDCTESEERRHQVEMWKRKKENFSLRKTELYRLSIANDLRDNIFWLPHSMDFRGRVYPVPPHFQHMGGDISRALLRFAIGKPLGPDGLYWLKLHLVNLTGLAKRASLSDRVKLADELVPEILDSADHPLDGRGWWKNDEDPWQTLACCMEIADALRSPDPEKFVSHFPVHQDGSCNGLQHYAALGRDALGAATVNLTPLDKPSDVYSDVVELVEKQRKWDANNGDKIAESLEGFVIRKVIKQSIMTTVYGVTEYGARLQIRRQLKDMDFPREHLAPACSYLAQLTLNSIGKIFTSSREIQAWFGQVAQKLVRDRQVPVRWDTPLRLPVRQPYMQKGKVLDEPNPMRQKNAFPPNFVHSLDSTHMMLTALHCQKQGITFVSVHDCFWTHASDVDVMNEVCRDQFVTLHKEPLLEQLAKSLRRRYRFGKRELAAASPAAREEYIKFNNLLEKPPARGDFDLDLVRKSTYFFC